MHINLSPAELQVITHALSVAAQRFREDAKLLREPIKNEKFNPYERLAEQFEKQEQDTLAVLIKMEEL